MIVVLSNANLLPMREFLPGDAAFGAFGQVHQELIDPTSVAHADGVDSVLVHVDADCLLGELRFRLPTPERSDAALSSLDSMLEAVDAFVARRPACLVILTTWALSPQRLTGHLDANSSASFTSLEEEANRRITAVSREHPSVLVLDWRLTLREQGWRTLRADRYWYLGRIPLSRAGHEHLAGAALQLLDAARGRSRKLLVLDLDGTLWGGVVGDDGVDALQLSEEGVGKAFRDVQQILRGARELGVLLAISSKNTEAVALDAIASHPMMALSLDDFVAHRIDWGDKAANIASMADELDLGLDSLVFLDDSPVERARVRSALPDVVVPDLPEDPADRPAWLLGEVLPRWFGRTALTAEDSNKTSQYHARAKRQGLRQDLDPTDFVRELDIELDLFVDDARFLPRLAQLTQKTNQFNMTAERLTTAEVAGLASSPDGWVAALKYRDRFGDEGIVGAALCRRCPGGWRVDNLLMSCRVLGRTVEHAFLAGVLEALPAEPDARLVARFVPTDRNAPACALYPAAGLLEAGPGQLEGGLIAARDRLRELTPIKAPRIHAHER